eukprot:g4596.t1
MRRRTAGPGGVFCLVRALVVGLVCCAVRVGADVKQQLTVTAPFDKHDHKGSRIIPYFEKTGATNIMQSFVRMTPDKTNEVGTLWSRSTLGSSDMSLEWKFRISGNEPTNYGDTIALIISPMKFKAGQVGRFFGIDENFTGMAIIVNTNRQLLSKDKKPGEPAGRHRDVAIVANNGTRSYADLIGSLEGCSANVRFDERRDDFNVMQSTRIRMKLSGNTVALEVDARNVGRWRRCATIAHLDMPQDWAQKCNVGIIAQTSDKSNNHDLLSLRVYNDAVDAWEVDTYDEDEDEMDSLMHHMEHELFNVYDSLQETINSLKQAEQEAEMRLETLEENLSKSVMQALEARVAKLEVQVQTSVSRSLNKHVNNVYGRLEEDVGVKLTEQVGKMSASWRWPFYALLTVVLGMESRCAVTITLVTLTLLAGVLAVDLEKIQKIAATSASADFTRADAYIAASVWHNERLLRHEAEGTRAPYVACTDYSGGRRAVVSLESSFGKSNVRGISNSEEDGACFIVTASPSAALDMLSDPAAFDLLSAGSFLPPLKLATGLLDHGDDISDGPERLRTSYGDAANLDNVNGFHVRLSPGILSVGDESRSRAFVSDWQSQIMQIESVKSMSFWSDPSFDRAIQDKVRVKEWSRAATVVDSLASKHGRPVGQICNLGELQMRHVGDDLLLVEGVNHLLPGDDRPSEVKMSCFMGLLVQLAAKPEVLRVSLLHRARTLNSLANAVVQSATTTETPLVDAGLDGAGEVIQVVDSGLDDTSCYFAEDDGLQIEHGHLFDGVRLEPDGNVSLVLDAYSFAYDMSHRKVVQYIEMFKKPDGSMDGGDGSDADDSFMYMSDYLGDPDDWTSDHYSSYYSSSSTWSEDSFCAGYLEEYAYYFDSLNSSSSSSSSPSSSSPSSSSVSFTGGFFKDTVAGHGTWVSGLAAGSISEESYAVAEEDCYVDELPGCVGGCIAASTIEELKDNEYFDLDTFCPMHDCDGDGSSSQTCLHGDPLENLHQHGGVAPAARVAAFDASYTGSELFVGYGGNLVWESSAGTGAKIHSNSWGGATDCEVTELDLLYDSFMFENPEHLLIFAAGNDGGYKDIPFKETCTVLSPALGKNSLAVGATSSGPSGGTDTGMDMRLIYDLLGITDYSEEGYPWICLYPSLGSPSSSTEQANIDTVAWFSSYGPTKDGRIKPEVVAPGDQVFGASSDGTDMHSCRLVSGSGTSGSCPLVAGSAALVRQYFKIPDFYAAHAGSTRTCTRGLSSIFRCSAFSPSAATVKAIIINSANLMGGSSEPDDFRGFGRVHLEAGMPLSSSGPLGILVADSSETSIGAYSHHTEEIFVDGDAGLELRATLSWLDPPATTLSATQLLHDLDLIVKSPSGQSFTMWHSGEPDKVNVVERVVVPAESVESGRWEVTVSSKGLTHELQSYSLVVTGGIGGC